MKINEIEITAHTDGSISKPNNNFKDKRIQRTFGTNARGYKQIFVGNKIFKVHRLIAKAHLPDYSEDLEVDHIDGKKENNDISNLRMASSSFQKRAHQDKAKGCSSQYRGVSWYKREKNWQANCTIEKKQKYLGSFDSEREAAIARDVYAFSQGFPLEGLNFPEHFDASLGI